MKPNLDLDFGLKIPATDGVTAAPIAEGVANVTQRTHELGIRMAMGAQRSDVIRLVVRHGASLAIGGVSIGLIVAAILTRVMEGLPFGVSATDPLTFAAILALLTGVALTACFIPARRATRVDPMVALRCE